MATTSFIAFGLSSGIPRNFYGDDLLLLRASEGSEVGNGYASSILFGFNDIGSGKWRPAFTTIVPAFLHIFGENYLGYFLLNSILFLAVVYLTVRILTQVFSVSSRILIVVGIALALNQFIWYSVWSPFGLMELGGMIFLLLALRSFAGAIKSLGAAAGWFSAMYVMIATCFHERYLIAILPLAAVALWVRDQKSASRVLAPWITLPFLYVATKIVVLKIDPLTGGGEQDFRQTSGYWIIDHFWSSLRSVLGLSDGRIVEFATGDGSRTPVEGTLQQVLFIINVLLILGILAALMIGWVHPGRLRELPDLSYELIARWVRVGILGVALALLIPASTVDSRIEGRWLFGSHCLLIAFVGSLTVIRLRLVRDLSPAILATLIFSGAAAVQNRSAFEKPMRDADRMIEIVKERPQAASPWALVIHDPENVGQWEWRLGYGDAFTKLENPPSAIVTSGSACTVKCIRIDIGDDRWIIREQSGGQPTPMPLPLANDF